MGTLKFFLTLSLVISHWAFATVRYVSHSGTNTPPYLTWETAADSIMSAINISSFGDTIYVANGVYEERVTMIPGLSLIGAGMDSCVIDMVALSPTQPNAVTMKDSCLVSGFKILFDSTLNISGAGIYMPESTKGCFVYNNAILYPTEGIWVTEGYIKKNYIITWHFGITGCVNDDSRNYVANIDSNFIAFAVYGIVDIDRTIINAKNNIFQLKSPNNIDGEVIDIDGLSFTSSANFHNNLITKSKYDIIYQKSIFNVVPGEFNINQFLSKYNKVFYNTSPLASFKNNNVINSVNASNGTGYVKYNNFWGVSNYSHDTTNISADPMFENEDSLDFHLQMYSPLIDAGDPNILDKDGSRSDIGLFGGPYGEKYTYRDLAPKPPSNLTASYDSGLVLLRWNKNTEADFSLYRVYRDTVADFIYDTTRIIAVVADTFFYDDLPEKYMAKNYYYKITALDSAGHQSAPSEEVHINITGVPEGPPKVVEHYQLLNNYPNPFNSGTIIPYRLKEPGYVKLYIYDIKGELVRVLVNQYQQSGYYEVRFNPTSGERKQADLGEGWWTGYNNDMATGIYLYQIMVRGEGNIPVFTDIGKMILLK